MSLQTSFDFGSAPRTRDAGSIWTHTDAIRTDATVAELTAARAHALAFTTPEDGFLGRAREEAVRRINERLCVSEEVAA